MISKEFLLIIMGNMMKDLMKRTVSEEQFMKLKAVYVQVYMKEKEIKAAKKALLERSGLMNIILESLRMIKRMVMERNIKTVEKFKKGNSRMVNLWCNDSTNLLD